MAEGLSDQEANALLDQFVIDYGWLQLHNGAPGANGTTNVATNSTRKNPSFNTAASGSINNSADIDWTEGEVSGTETYTYFTMWDASAGSPASGFGGSGSVSANQVSASGDSFSILSGGLTISFTTAS